MLRPNFVMLNGTYRENGNTITIQTDCAPLSPSPLPSSMTLAVTRKLFRRRLETASLELRIGSRPHVSLNFLFPTIFGLRSLESCPPGSSIPPSSSGLNIGTTHKSFGLTFESVLPKLVGEWGVTFSELALQLKLGLECGFSGIQYVCSGSWSNDTTQISASTVLSPMGIVVQLELVDSFYCQDKILSHVPPSATHMEQRASFPIVISLEYDVSLAFWTVLVPSTVLLLGHQFIIKPRRRRKRLA
jgi:hypothetical protein